MVARHVMTLAGCALLLATQTALVAQDKKDSPPPAIDPVGRPKEFKGGEALKFALWHDGENWQIRSTSKKAKKGNSVIHRWTGSVSIDGDTFSGKFDKLETARRAENADWLITHPNGRGFDFQLVNRGGVDELTFQVGPNAKSITFKVRIDNQKQPTYILIGKNSTKPEKTEFTLPAHPNKKE